MEEELLPCPFCKDGGKPERHSTEHFVGNPSSGIVEMEDWVTCIICGASADTHVWNQRAERTCKAITECVSDDGSISYPVGFICSACEHQTWQYNNGEKANYCPNCGAKVVE